MRVLKDIPLSDWGYVNLGTEAKAERIKRGRHQTISPYLQPAKTQALVDRIYRRDHIAASYGGWLEDRYPLWQGNYLDEGEKYFHIGVDFNVPDGTNVYATHRCRVDHVGNDHPTKGGWGSHVIVRLESGEGYLLYAHLDRAGLPDEGDLLHVGKIIGMVGAPRHNGKWFSHLHVQLITPDAWAYYSIPKHWPELDGYCSEKDLRRMVKLFRDPLPWVA